MGIQSDLKRAGGEVMKIDKTTGIIEFDSISVLPETMAEDVKFRYSDFILRTDGVAPDAAADICGFRYGVVQILFLAHPAELIEDQRGLGRKQHTVAGIGGIDRINFFTYFTAEAVNYTY